MAKLSEQVQNQIRVSDKVVASARTHAGVIAKALAEEAVKVQGPLTEATPKVYHALLAALADGLAHSTRALRDTEQALAAERADDVPVRASRDGATSALSALLGLLRRTIEDHLGATALAQYGLASESPRVPAKLVEYAKNVVRLLDESPVVVVSPLGSTFDSNVASQAVTKQCNGLALAVEDDHREARELETALANRDRAGEAWSETYQGTAGVLEGFYRLAGWKELAEKVRPTQRKLRGEDAGADLDAPGPEDPPAGG